MLVQIFEVQSPAGAAALARLGVDHIGVLVGDGAFPRELPAQRARAIFAAVLPPAKRVALSLSAELADVVRAARETQADLVQVQAGVDDFPTASLVALKAALPATPVIRAVPVIDETAIAIARSCRGIADFLLLDSYDPASRQFGALGRTHDWTLSRRIVDEVGIPSILAGGLGPDNVAAAVAAVRPAGVDSKSRTDAADGRTKDLAKVRAFVRAAAATPPDAAAPRRGSGPRPSRQS
jgi:phosphoribosylanthranilate isomerase